VALIVAGEPAHAAGLRDTEDADDLVAGDQRRVDLALVAVLLEERQLGRREAGVIDVVLHRLARQEQAPQVAALG